VALEERDLVLDDEDLLEIGGHPGEGLVVDREGHREAHQAHAQRVELGLAEPEVVERALHRREPGARRDDAEAGVAGGEGDPVEAGVAGVGLREVEAAGEHVVLGVQGRRADQRRGRRTGL
jgi:hypothetical protein